jgi:class 3 adenylate cyclase
MILCFPPFIRSSTDGEPKLVTALFADVTNYTAVSDKPDPEEGEEGALRINDLNLESRA